MVTHFPRYGRGKRPMRPRLFLSSFSYLAKRSSYRPASPRAHGR